MLGNSLVRIFIAAMKHHDHKASKGVKGLLCYTSTELFIRKKSGQELKQGRIPDAGAYAEAMKIAA